MRYAHVFRRDGVNHAILTERTRIKRNGRHHTICAKRIDETFQRRPVSWPGNILAPVTCDACLSFMTALLDILEEEEEATRGETADAPA